MLSGIAADDQADIGILDVYPMVRHCPATERFRQTGDRGAVSNSRLMVYMDNSHGTHGLYYNRGLLIAHLGRTHVEKGVDPVDHLAGFVFRDEVLITRLLYSPGKFVDHPTPAFFFPFLAEGRTVERFNEPVVAVYHGQHCRALCAKGAFAYRIARISFRADNLAVPNVGDKMTAYGAEWADRYDLPGPFNFQFLGV